MFKKEEKTKVTVIIPLEEFEVLYRGIRGGCRHKGCRFSRTTCHVRDLKNEIQKWWNRTNGEAPGFKCYEMVFDNAIRVENKLYWMFWTDGIKPCQKMHNELASQVRLAFKGQPLDTKRTWYC